MNLLWFIPIYIAIFWAGYVKDKNERKAHRRVYKRKKPHGVRKVRKVSLQRF
jgi:cadmium resistance protein CadD (predicted permease)